MSSNFFQRNIYCLISMDDSFVFFKEFRFFEHIGIRLGCSEL